MSERIVFYCQYRKKEFNNYKTFCRAMGCKKKIKTCSLVKRIKEGQKKLRRFAKKESKIMQQTKIKKCPHCNFESPYVQSMKLHKEFMAGIKGHPKAIYVKKGREKVLVFAQ